MIRIVVTNTRGLSDLGPYWPRLTRNRVNLELFKDTFQHKFGSVRSVSQTLLKADIKTPVICPI